MELRRTIPILFVLALLVCPSVADERRDGNWWRRLDALEKLHYITGFFDGMGIGT